MDSRTGFDDDDFFGSYDAEKAQQMSVTPLEFDEDARPPSREQLAHWARFRKPVGVVVGAMALLSFVALAKLGAHEQSSERQLVAHYGSAIAATASSPISAAIAAAGAASAPRAPSDASSSVLPEELSALVSEVWSVFASDGLPKPDTTVPLLVTGDADPAPESAAHDSPVPGLSAGFDSNPTAVFPSAAVSQMCLLPEESAERAKLSASSAARGQASRTQSLPASKTSLSPSAHP